MFAELEKQSSFFTEFYAAKSAILLFYLIGCV